MREVIRLKLDDGVDGAEYNELVYDEYGSVGFDSDFKPTLGPLEFKLEMNNPTYIVEVRSKDNGQIPHFHIFDVDKKFQTCVRIDLPQYFHHKAYTGVLDRKGRKALNELLERSVPVNGSLHTNWWRIVEAWNANSERQKVGANIAQPDYSTLPFKRQ